ncbi:hypothetical protein ColTof4_05125 [Colletotrichum tofieldiae]|uniref:Uncharacterized protein n=1 Tax=Colletotrichum tofieldiae TaxID=708197 RepID=A0A166QDQ6_9PEZI|nr:hypothetical protein CT0861_07284 [Colletotrichum tofieldiae]GKT63290.1 hypothetical protein ColTof3_10629 [Colletotrichum tofieldiae]GKT72702.1 hypothetical protein ColTof4_05125 [Colletotrichum tofieldiae]GKT89457.1 hypothetical protein Ct61P_07307 [Colletotrichum tofieldiae]
MQLMKSIFVLGLLAVQSLAEPVRIANSKNPAVVEYRAAVAAHNQKRQTPPGWVPAPRDAPDVDMGSFDKVGRGQSIKTEGLASCIAVVVYNKSPQEDDNDKFLAHVSPASWQNQLNKLFEAMDLSDPRVMVIFPLPKDTVSPEVQREINEKVLEHVFDQWGDYDPKGYVRDGSRVDEVGGSRLWVDEDNVVHWSVTGAVIQPRN